MGLEALGMDPGARIFAADFTIEMITRGRGRKGSDAITWCQADALDLPYRSCIFDSVVSSYLIRNVTDFRGAFEEQLRVVKPGGTIVCLDTTPPRRGIFRPLVLLYLKFVVPLMGYLIGREIGAYTYLPESTRKFIRPEELAEVMKEAGLKDVSFSVMMFGTQALHTGKRPLKPDDA